MSKIKLTYFNSPGRAEPVRVVLRLAGVEFEDHRVDFAGFGALKASGALPLGSLPVLEVDGVVFTQTTAMLRYAARAFAPDLYPSDPVEGLVVDSALETINDTVSHALAPSFWEQDADKKLAMRKEFAAGPLARAMGYLEGLVARSGGPFFLGERPSIADVLVGNQLAQIASGRLDGLSAETIAPYPKLAGLLEACTNHPKLAAARG